MLRETAIAVIVMFSFQGSRPCIADTHDGTTIEYSKQKEMDFAAQLPPMSDKQRALFNAKHYTRTTDLKGEGNLSLARKYRTEGDMVQAFKYYNASVIAFAEPKERAAYKTQEMFNFKLGWAYGGRAYCYLKQHKYKEAIADLTKAIKLRPEYDVNYRNRGTAYQALGEIEKSKQDLAKANSMAPNRLPKFMTNP